MKTGTINKQVDKLMIQDVINDHNEAVLHGNDKFIELKELGLKILESFKNLNKEDTIKYYDMMEDSVVKFDLFLQIKQQWIKPEIKY